LRLHAKPHLEPIEGKHAPSARLSRLGASAISSNSMPLPTPLPLRLVFTFAEHALVPDEHFLALRDDGALYDRAFVRVLSDEFFETEPISENSAIGKPGRVPVHHQYCLHICGTGLAGRDERRSASTPPLCPAALFAALGLLAMGVHHQCVKHAHTGLQQYCTRSSGRLYANRPTHGFSRGVRDGQQNTRTNRA
jgi:hypothetical protein